MGFRDLVLFYVVTGISLRWIATAASIGPSSLVIWIGAWLLFYLPLALAVIELSSRYPQEGGLYVWTRKAFGDGAGFLAAWLYWNSNLPYFPTVLYFAASNLLFLRAGWRGQSHNEIYFFWFTVGTMIVLTLLNLVGLNIAKWTYNVGALAMWIPAVMVVVMGVVAWAHYGAANSFAWHALLPGLRLKEVMFWSTIVFALGGIIIGMVLGSQFTVLAVLPASICAVIIGTGSALVGMSSGQTASAISEMALLLAFLQAGYFLGHQPPRPS